MGVVFCGVNIPNSFDVDLLEVYDGTLGQRLLGK